MLFTVMADEHCRNICLIALHVLYRKGERMVKLSDFASAPLYNIKAVVQATDISPSTLRAWERRYEFCTPHRSDSGYRLYSDRDIAVIRWLKIQVESGMAISQAVTWYHSLVEQEESVEQTVLPTPNDEVLFTSLNLPRRSKREEVPSFEKLQSELITALTAYQETEAESILTETYSIYPIEDIGEQLITPVLIEIGEQWHNGQISVAREHFATNYIRQHLLSILRGTRNNIKGELVWVACAPEEQHEIGLILLAVYLKRAGFQVRYLGSRLPIEGLSVDIAAERPAMVMFSASTEETAKQLEQLTEMITLLDGVRPIIGYGGRAFNQNSALREQITGVYLGESSLQAVEIAQDLLNNGTPIS